jgi:choline kinase
MSIKNPSIDGPGIDKAVILAAGSGHRISRVGSTPKPLLPLTGVSGAPTFLDWHVARLSAAGVRDITIVGNHVTFEAHVAVPPGTQVRWVLNPTEDLSKSGSAHSAWFAWQSPHNILDGRSRVLLMDADILYEPAVMQLMAAGPARPRSTTLVCGDYEVSDEEVMVFADAHGARAHGKGLFGTAMVQGMRCLGEATGMVLFEPQDHALVSEATDWLMRYSRARVCSDHEDITQLVMRAGRMDAVCFQGLRFMECDTPEEYDVLTSTLYPAVRSLAEIADATGGSPSFPAASSATASVVSSAPSSSAPSAKTSVPK